MLNNKSVLKFFSHDSDKSKMLEAELAQLKAQVKAVNDKTSESELKRLQEKTDLISAQVVALRTIGLMKLSITEFKNLPHIKIDEKDMTNLQVFEQRKATILRCSELTKEQFDLLATPDFHHLYQDVCHYILTPADAVNGEILDEDTFSFDLLHTFENEVGEKIEHVRFRVPKTIHSEKLAELTDDEEREDFMFRVVTGLEQRDFEYLSTNDYLALKPQVGAFF
ncbi:putative uncharacterized phage protein [Aliivibrio wodanis]|uniref:Uncharacterized phage protein n=1 Tax=Aliivibrio wodanis TaxID=80852 RepID=A0A090IQA6_9GAMM|nr:putative uncharacterized phage protein [Aliivibrio wodanis]